jgi:hypothetical protein
MGLGALGRVAVVKDVLATLSGSPAYVLAATAALLATIILRRRQGLVSDRHRDWLGALPNDLSVTARAALGPLPISAGAVGVAAVATLIANLPFSACTTLVLACMGGYLVAIAVVLVVVSGKRRGVLGMGARAFPASRYAVVRRVHRNWASRPRLAPLGYWSVAQAGFWDRPKKRARSLIPWLLGLPLGTPGAVVLAVASAWLVLLHLVNLVGAAIRVAFAASWWLAPTPVGILHFTVAVSHRALGRQIIACSVVVAAVCAIAGQTVWRAALTGASWWVGIACLVSATACLVALGSNSMARSVLHRWMR